MFTPLHGLHQQGSQFPSLVSITILSRLLPCCRSGISVAL
jgi:hypothetical protein